MNQKINKHKAFTLIELLVVIAIIGILSSVVLASLSGARESARDAQRQQDIQQIRTALEMYINDSGEAPSGSGASGGWYRSYAANWDDLESDLAPYINQLPQDPINESSESYYLYKSTNSQNTGDCNFDASEDNFILLVPLKGETDSIPFFNSYNGYNRYCIIG